MKFIKKFVLDIAALKHEGRIILYALACIVVAFLISFLMRDLGLVVFKQIAKKGEISVASYLKEEEVYVLKRTQEFTEKQEVREAIADEDFDRIQSLLEDVQQETGLDAFVAADEEGISFSRVPRFTDLGGNVFLTSPIGPSVARGVSAVTYTVGRNFPLTLAAGVPLVEGGILRGAVFGGYWFDDGYAKLFKEKYLPKRQEVVFYSKEDGMTGTTFTATSTRQVLSMYLNHASVYVREGKSGDVMSIEGKDYVVTNHILSNERETVGGVLLLTPLPLSIFWRSLAVSLIVAIVFFIIALSTERITFRKTVLKRNRAAVVLLSMLAVALFIASWYGLYSHAKRIVDMLNKPIFSIYNSTLRIRPESGVFVSGYQQQISVIIRSGGESVNAVETILNYDPQHVRVDDVLMNRSICPSEFILEKEIDNELGVVKIACTVPGEGFVDVRGTVADLVITPLAAGESYFSFDEGTRVLAHDGLATNVLRTVTGAYYRIFDRGEVDTFSKDTLVIPFSQTHENSSRWYSSRQVVFTWIPVDGVEYLYDFSQNASSSLETMRVTRSNTITLQAPSDGVYYFKLIPRKGNVTGKMSIFTVKIDTTAPSVPVINASSLFVKAGEVVRFELESNDSHSGVQRYFYVSMDGGISLPAARRMYVPFKNAGTYTVHVRAFDTAENYSDNSVTVKVYKK